MKNEERETADGMRAACFEGGECRELAPRLEMATLRGSWHDMGRQYGTLLREPLGRTLEWAGRMGDEQSDAFFSPGGVPSGMAFMDDFFAGVSETGGLTVPELIRAGGLEIAYAGRLGEALERAGKCATIAIGADRARDGKIMVGRNYDWLPEFSALDLAVCVMEPAGERPLVSVNFAGCFYLTTGMNGDGLFVELNSGIFADDAARPERCQNAWRLWEILRSAATAREALARLAGEPAAEAYLIGLADADLAAVYEWAVDRPSAAVTLDPGEGFLAFTNHFIRPGWRNLPAAGAGGRASSLSRRRALLRQAAGLPEKAALEDLQRLLAADVGHGGARWDGTLFQIIAVPADKMLMIRRQDDGAWLPIPWTEGPGRGKGPCKKPTPPPDTASPL